MRSIDADALYEHTAEWEAQALAQVERFDPREDRDEWLKWTYILNERTAFKHDVADAPTVENWMDENKGKILQAGKEGREVEFRIGGRLFRIREVAQ